MDVNLKKYIKLSKEMFDQNGFLKIIVLAITNTVNRNQVNKMSAISANIFDAQIKQKFFRRRISITKDTGYHSELQNIQSKWQPNGPWTTDVKMVEVEIYSGKRRRDNRRMPCYPKQTQGTLRNKISIVWLHFNREKRRKQLGHEGT